MIAKLPRTIRVPSKRRKQAEVRRVIRVAPTSKDKPSPSDDHGASPAEVNYFLESAEDVMDHVDRAELPVGTSMAKLVIHLLSEAKREKVNSVQFRISFDRMAKSYRDNPGLFGQSIEVRCPYPAVHSYEKRDHLYVFAGSNRLPVSFTRQMILAIRKDKKFTCRRQLVPSTYRRRPATITRRVEQETGYQIAFVAKGNGSNRIYTWTRV